MAKVRVGVGCFVLNEREQPGRFLMGRRRGSHGAGKLALPGGHLELGESWEDCAVREIGEEANLLLENVRFAAVTNSPNMDGNPEKHYVTILMAADVREDSTPLDNLEPHKCDGWEWVSWEDLLHLFDHSKERLFEPLIDLITISRTRPF